MPFARPRFRTQLLLVCSALVVGTASAMLVPLFLHARVQALSVFRERLMAVAHGASAAISADTVERLAAAPEGTTIPYLVTRQVLREFSWRAGDSTHVDADDGLMLVVRAGERWRVVAHADWPVIGERPRTWWTPPADLANRLGNIRAGVPALWWFTEHQRLLAVSPVFAGTVPVGLVVAAVPRSAAVAAMRKGLLQVAWYPVVALAVAIFIAAWLSRQLTRRVERLASQARVLATGDLRHAIIDVADDEFGVLAGALRELSTQLRSVLGDVHAGADQVRAAVAQLAAGTDEMHVQNAQVLAAARSIAQAAAAQTDGIRSISLIASTAAQRAEEVRSHADKADATATHIANAARRVVTESDEALSRMTTISTVTAAAMPAVAELESKSQRIATVASAIAELADQANLLSINAAIESARAGVHGRAFGVVAGEVRSLADATTSALGNIHALAADIESVLRQTGVRMAEMHRSVMEGEAGIHSSSLAVQQILASVEAGRAATSTIVDHAAAQLVRASSVSAHVHAIAEAASENAGAAQQVSAAVEAQGVVAATVSSSTARLSDVAAQLQASLTGFRL